ncbi:MAG: sugar kinase [Chloroflexi bacterium]|nr:MAG: sugar kinase [Chloroflexota bacterium]RLT34258.1 MAG: sugar kinase [Chloroflexota bacterium]
MVRQGTIVAVGDLVWDVLVQPDTLLLPGGDTTGKIAVQPGGSAANVAAWIARLGGPAGFVGSVGNDPFGDMIVADLEREGVQCAIARSDSLNTGVIAVMIDRGGQRSMITNQGADFCLLPSDLPNAMLTDAAHVHITAWSLFSDPPRAAALAAAQMAKAAGATVSFDPASYQMIRELGHDRFDATIAALPVDIVFPNRDEGMILTGEKEPIRIAAALRRRFADAIVVLKLDKDGCYVSGPTYQGFHPSRAVDMVDATGAGDSFNAGFLARYLRDGDLAAAADLANACGSWVVSRFGARPPVDEDFRVRSAGLI